MDAAFVLVEAGPAPGAIVLARRDPPRAGHAADGGIAVLHQGMARQLVRLGIGFQFRPGPLPQRIEAEAAFELFHRLHAGAFAGLEALAPGDLGVERLQRLGQRASPCGNPQQASGSLRPQRAVGIVRAARLRLAAPRLRTSPRPSTSCSRSRYRKVSPNSLPVLRNRIGVSGSICRHQMQQHRRFRAEGRHHRGAACEFAGQRQFQNAMGVAARGLLLQRGQMRPHTDRWRRCRHGRRHGA